MTLSPLAPALALKIAAINYKPPFVGRCRILTAMNLYRHKKPHAYQCTHANYLSITRRVRCIFATETEFRSVRTHSIIIHLSSSHHSFVWYRYISWLSPIDCTLSRVPELKIPPSPLTGAEFMANGLRSPLLLLRYHHHLRIKSPQIVSDTSRLYVTTVDKEDIALCFATHEREFLVHRIPWHQQQPTP